MKPGTLTALLLGLGLLLEACTGSPDRATSVSGVYFRPNGPYWGGGCQLELYADGTFRSFDQPSAEESPTLAGNVIGGTYEVRRDSLRLYPRGTACNLATVIAAFEMRDGRLCFRNYTASSYECFEKKYHPGDLSELVRF